MFDTKRLGAVRSVSRIPPENCCIKECFSNKELTKSTRKSDLSEKKKKLTLTSFDQSETQKNFYIVSKQRRRSMVTILEPDYQKNESILKLSSRLTNEDSLRRSSQVQSTIMRANYQSQVMRISNYDSNHFIESVKANHQIMRNSVKQKKRPKSSLNSLKATKISINPLILSRPSTVLEISSSPITKRNTNIYNSCLSSSKISINPCQKESPNFANQKTDQKTYSAKSIFESNFGTPKCLDSLNYLNVKQVQSPLLLKSAVSHDLSSSFVENNTSQVILKIEVQGANTKLQRGDLRQQQSLVKRKLKKQKSRIITFAGQINSDVSQNVDSEDALTTIYKSFKTLVHFQQYFSRGGFIGAGRISTVYRVQQKKTKLVLSSKEVFKKIVYENNLQQELNQFILDHYNLPNHKNVVTLYGTFEDTGRYYFVTELCETNLRSVIKSKTKISEEKVLQYIQQILQGLSFLHQNNIIHKHINPENILISLGVCKLSDFGWNDKLLQMSNHKPNYEYSSPQMGLGNQVDYKTDCWSLGIVAFQLFFNQLPVGSQQDIILSNLQKIQTLSTKSKTLLQGLLQIDPKDRFTLTKALETMRSSIIPQLTLSKIQQLIS